MAIHCVLQSLKQGENSFLEHSLETLRGVQVVKGQNLALQCLALEQAGESGVSQSTFICAKSQNMVPHQHCLLSPRGTAETEVVSCPQRLHFLHVLCNHDQLMGGGGGRGGGKRHSARQSRAIRSGDICLQQTWMTGTSRG